MDILRDWDYYGLPGEYVYGDAVFVDDYYMDERWKVIPDFPDYLVSNRGRIWSSISNNFVTGTPNIRSGHVDVSLQQRGRREHRYLHRLVAEAFIPNPHGLPLVRHLDDDPSNNEIENLAWGTQYDNVHDAISNRSFRYLTNEDRELAMQKRRMPIVAIRFADGERLYFDSQQEASRVLYIDQASIHSVLNGKTRGVKGYFFVRDGESEMGFEDAKRRYSRKKPMIVATDIDTGERIVFKGLTRASEELGVSVSAISMVLHGKMSRVKNWRFEYLGEGY